MKIRALFVTMLLGLAACGGSGGGGEAAPAPPLASDPWTAVAAALENHGVEDLALIVGDATGERYRYEKGAFQVADPYAIASASKWLTGATVVALIEQGVMTLDDRPQDYLPYWTDDPADPRSQITLEQLLSFTSGFHRSPVQRGCIGNETYDVQSCVLEWYAIGVDAPPGTTYFYGPVHMQVAAAMAEIATGQPWSQVVTLTIASPLGLSNTGFIGDNPLASGGARSSALDYAEFLRAQLVGDLIGSSFDTLAAERLSGIEIVSRPGSIDDGSVDWYYGLGVWRECNQPMWNASCDASVRVSSAGAFGWYPWLDLDNGYYAVLAMEEPAGLFSSPASESVQLGVVLQPLILEALSD